jgi:NitT/TauT family transport system permease protein
VGEGTRRRFGSTPIRRLMNVVPGRGAGIMLALLPFVLIAIVYTVASAERRAANADDKVLPPPAEMAQTVARLAFQPDRRTGTYVLWTDTEASLERLLTGLAIATSIGLGFGLALGLLSLVKATLGSLVAVLSMIPPMALLPILFITFGLGDLSKIVLIVFGVAPFMSRDLALAVAAIPREQLIKAQTLGASTWQVALRVVLPQIMPRLIEAVRLSLGPSFLFLIAAEAIAADVGLGYRIFLVRRYLQMDVILPYVAWITLIAYLMDFALARLARGAFAWAYAEERR